MKFWNKKILNKKFVFIVFKDSYKYGQIVETNEHEDFLLIKMLSAPHSGLFLYDIDQLRQIDDVDAPKVILYCLFFEKRSELDQYMEEYLKKEKQENDEKVVPFLKK